MDIWFTEMEILRGGKIEKPEAETTGIYIGRPCHVRSDSLCRGYQNSAYQQSTVGLYSIFLLKRAIV